MRLNCPLSAVPVCSCLAEDLESDRIATANGDNEADSYNNELIADNFFHEITYAIVIGRHEHVCLPFRNTSLIFLNAQVGLRIRLGFPSRPRAVFLSPYAVHTTPPCVALQGQYDSRQWSLLIPLLCRRYHNAHHSDDVM